MSTPAARILAARDALIAALAPGKAFYNQREWLKIEAAINEYGNVAFENGRVAKRLPPNDTKPIVSWDLEGTEVEVEYSFSPGRPATRLDPPDPEEIEILSIWHEGAEITGALGEARVEEIARDPDLIRLICEMEAEADFERRSGAYGSDD